MSQTHTAPEEPTTAQPDAEPSGQIAGLSEQVFDHEHDGHVDADSLEGALASLLALYPEVPVVALEASGVIVPMPDSVALRRNVVLTGRSGLDLVVQGDRVGLLATWDRVLAGGAGRCLAHMASDPESTVTFAGFDLRERHGAVLAVFVPAAGADGDTHEARELPPVLPRFATIFKNERSFIVKIDEEITQLLGWRAEDVVGHRSIEFIHPDDHALAIDNWMEMLAAPGPGRRVRLRHRRADGSWVWFEVTNHNLLDDPDHRCVVSEMVDISEEMAAHEALRAREQLLDRLAEAIPVGLFQLDSERQIVYTNDRLHEILGVERASTVEEQLAAVVDADRAALQQALEDVLAGTPRADIEVKLQIAATQELRFCAISLRALSYEDGTTSGAIACVSDVTDSARMREELKRRATFDQLTGCYNRASIMLALGMNIGAGERQADRAVMFLDLDGFKEVNDRRGHAAGDRLLELVAKRLKGALRAEDLVGRIGGDEFLVVCPDIGGPERSVELAQRLIDAVRGDGAAGADAVAHVSVGVAWSSGEAVDADTLVARADRAMYRAKRAKTGRPQLAGAEPEILARRAQPVSDR